MEQKVTEFKNKKRPKLKLDQMYLGTKRPGSKIFFEKEKLKVAINGLRPKKKPNKKKPKKIKPAHVIN